MKTKSPKTKVRRLSEATFKKLIKKLVSEIVTGYDEEIGKEKPLEEEIVDVAPRASVVSNRGNKYSVKQNYARKNLHKYKRVSGI